MISTKSSVPQTFPSPKHARTTWEDEVRGWQKGWAAAEQCDLSDKSQIPANSSDLAAGLR